MNHPSVAPARTGLWSAFSSLLRIPFNSASAPGTGPSHSQAQVCASPRDVSCAAAPANDGNGNGTDGAVRAAFKDIVAAGGEHHIECLPDVLKESLSHGVHKRKLYLILLNWELPRSTAKFWQAAEYRVCADGGANRLYDELPTMFPERSPESVRRSFLPDIIHGDLDSLRPDVREFYVAEGVRVCNKAIDQDTTDLQKCILLLQQHISDAGDDPTTVNILTLGALGGRLDHTLCNLNTLFLYSDLHLTLCGDGNLTRLLRPGRNILNIDRAVEGPHCGLVPLGAPVMASSQGLQWNLDVCELSFKGLISTSNLVTDDTVIIDCDKEVLWTVSMADDMPLEAELVHAASKLLDDDDADSAQAALVREWSRTIDSASAAAAVADVTQAQKPAPIAKPDSATSMRPGSTSPAGDAEWCSSMVSATTGKELKEASDEGEEP